MKILVSRKTLSLIHLVPGVLSVDLDIAQSIHQGVEFLSLSLPGGELSEPFAESSVQGSVLRLCGTARFFDQMFVGAERDVLHCFSVHENSVIKSHGGSIKQR